MPSRQNRQARNGDEDREHPVRAFGVIDKPKPTDEQIESREERRRRMLEEKPSLEERRTAIERQQKDAIDAARRNKDVNKRTEAPRPYKRVGEDKPTYDTLKERGEDLDKAIEEQT